MGSRGNLAGIGLGNHVDVFQNRRKLLLGALAFVIGQRESRQHRHMIHSLAINTHNGVPYSLITSGKAAISAAMQPRCETSETPVSLAPRISEHPEHQRPQGRVSTPRSTAP